jgi:hypothetical protein
MYKIRKIKGVKLFKRKTNCIKLNEVIYYNIIVYYIHGDINKEIVKFYKVNKTIANKVIK